MRYLALACNYDRTLAEGRVPPETVAALEHLRASGRHLLLVTGRELDDLLAVCPHVPLFDRVVAENGAVRYYPARQELTQLSAPPPDAFIRTLQARGVTPPSSGRVIVASWEPYETAVLEAIRDLGLELRVTFDLLPAAWQTVSPVLTPPLPGVFLITVHPDQVAPAVLTAVDHVIAVSAAPERTLAAYSKALGEQSPTIAPVVLEPGTVAPVSGQRSPSAILFPPPHRSPAPPAVDPQAKPRSLLVMRSHLRRSARPRVRGGKVLCANRQEARQWFQEAWWAASHT